MSDYKRIMALGNWLNRFLSPTLSSWDIEELADDAIKLMNIDHVRSDDDPVVNTIREIIKKYDGRPVVRNTSSSSAVSKDDISRQVGLPADHTTIVEDVTTAFWLAEAIEIIIPGLQHSPSTPWENFLCSMDEYSANEYHLIDDLLREYNNIREAAVKKDRKVALVNKMIYPWSYSDKWPDTPRGDHLEWIRFPALVSKIFITFLREGGRDYCGMCKNCGQFILAERKGRREFCSGRCRIAHKRKADLSVTR